MTSALDIIDILNEEHSALRRLCADVGRRSPNESTVHLELGDRVLRHEIAEELVVFPVLLGYRGGASVADACLDDQVDIEGQLILLERQEPGTKEFKRISNGLARDLFAHLDQEDAKVLPIIASRLGRSRRIELGSRFREVIELAPPHKLPLGRRITTGRTVVDRTSALSVWMRDVAAASGLAG